MYKFIYVDDDKRILKYKDKELEFIRDVELATKFEELNKRTRMKMMLELTKQGMTIDDIVVKKEIDGKIIEDHSNENALYRMFQGEEILNLYDEISKKYFGMTLNELIEDIGLTKQDETMKFGEEFTKALAGVEKGKTPKKSQ